jgi:hypothetical protein
MASSSAVTYALTFVNNSSNAWSACVYQTDPDINLPNVQSLAWFAEVAAPTTNLVFDWQINYAFTWAETGALIPGVVYKASQTWAADLTSTNQVNFKQPQSAQGPYYTLENQRQGPNGGSLYITEDHTVGLGQASIGVAMSGAGVFAVEAEPNLNLIFTPHPIYWITFGQFVQGQVMDITEVTNSAAIQFPPGVYNMTATLNLDNTWTVGPS